jgi:hypothetical protein
VVEVACTQGGAPVPFGALGARRAALPIILKAFSVKWDLRFIRKLKKIRLLDYSDKNNLT